MKVTGAKIQQRNLERKKGLNFLLKVWSITSTVGSAGVNGSFLTCCWGFFILSLKQRKRQYSFACAPCLPSYKLIKFKAAAEKEFQLVSEGSAESAFSSWVMVVSFNAFRPDMSWTVTLGLAAGSGQDRKQEMIRVTSHLTFYMER